MDPKVLQQLLDALTVTIAVQDRHARMLVDHEDWLVTESRAIARHEEFLEQHQAFLREHEAIMHSIDHNLKLLSDLIVRSRDSGNGGGQSGPTPA